VSYTYSDNLFSLDDDDSGLLSALGLDLTDEEHYTAAQDAVVLIDDDEVTISDNYIDYDNEVLNGVRLDFKGVGKVSVDVTQDTDKTVESIETFVESYNTLMDWINTRSSEKQVNTDYSEDSDSNYLSRSSDDFHTSWGLLYGNSYLRNTKSALRSIISQDYAFTFKERTSAEAIYGDMSNNGIKRTTLSNGTEEDGSATLSIKVGDHSANITITSSDTLETIAAKINDTTGTEDSNEAWGLHHDSAGTLQNYVKAEVVDSKLVIKQGSTAGTDEISLSGTTALNALKMNTTYRGLYQIGIETTSDNYGMSGEIEFDSQAFLDAMEENPEETEQLMLAFAKQMDSQVKSMLQSSSTYSGTLKTEITNIETQITSIDEYLSKFQERLDRMEESLRSQYAAAEERISELSQQASSISGILSQLSGGGSAS
ncbi:MAG: flagellar filament capping protein FliD, partial [Fretibacterium sp.]|nr:flagellar filament capping protein FliD [Fretibacterium sp.]